LKHFFYIGFIRFIYHGGIGKITLPFGGFFGQDVTFVSMLAFDLSGAGDVKSLFGAGFRFHFWHFSVFMDIGTNYFFFQGIQTCFLRTGIHLYTGDLPVISLRI